MSLFKILLDPENKVVLKSTLYRLMEEVGGKQLVNVCMREDDCKWLQAI